MTVNGKPFLDVSNIAERTWKEKVRNATELEMKWVAEALPMSVIEDELRRRTQLMMQDLGEFLNHAIRIEKEEKRRLGVQ